MEGRHRFNLWPSRRKAFAVMQLAWRARNTPVNYSVMYFVSAQHISYALHERKKKKHLSVHPWKPMKIGKSWFLSSMCRCITTWQACTSNEFVMQKVIIIQDLPRHISGRSIKLSESQQFKIFQCGKKKNWNEVIGGWADVLLSCKKHLSPYFQRFNSCRNGEQIKEEGSVNKNRKKE